MSRFLRVGMIRDKIEDIIEASSMLLAIVEDGRADSLERVKEIASDIKTMAHDLKEFISRWDCEPIIYTGRGTTDEIIRMLDRLIVKAESAESRDLQG